MTIIDAECTSAGETSETWESPTKTTDPVRYSRRCARIRRSQARKWDRRINNLLTTILGLLAFASVLALLVG